MNYAISLVRALRRLLFRVRSMRASVSYGPGFVVGPNVRAVPGVRVQIGSRVNVAANVDIQTNLEIGDDVMISSSVAFIGNDHEFSDPSKSIQDQALRPKATIRLGGDNLIGYGTIVLGNVSIGRGAIVGAGSLVTKSLPQDSVCVGRPARPVGKRRS